MRILHTSDWHLGQHFFGQSRLAEHQAFIEWLIEIVQHKQVDVVLIAGDIFDTGTPPSYARECYHHCMVRLHQLKVQCVVLGGNHDSVAMLQESQDLLGCLNIQVVPGFSSQPEKHLIALYNHEGVQQAWLCALPYLRPRDLVTSQAGQTQQEKQTHLMQAMALTYQRIKSLADQQQGDFPIVGTGHLTTVGAQLSESVRELYIGLLDAFPADAFPNFDYLALGHIHRSQRVAGSEVMRYSGSPIALSFDEAQQPKKVLLVDLEGNGKVCVSEQVIPAFRHLVSLKTTLSALAGQLTDIAQQASEEWPAWVEIRVDSDAYLTDLQPRIESLCAELPIEILRIRRERVVASDGLLITEQQMLSELSAEQVFSRRLDQETLESEDRDRLIQLHRELLHREMESEEG